MYIYIYTQTLSAFCISVKHALIIQQDIIFKTDISILTNLHICALNVS